MELTRRGLLQLGVAATSGAATTALAAQGSEAPKEKAAASPNYVGVLVDTTLCIGCRKCEEACNRRNHLPRTAESFSDRDILRTFRRIRRVCPIPSARSSACTACIPPASRRASWVR